MNKLYIAGPMSGIPQFNYPAFYAAAKAARKMGWSVFSPAEMDDPEMQQKALQSQAGRWCDLEGCGETWGDVLAKDVKLVSDVIDSLALLPGWENSRGARLEAFVALSVGKPVYKLVDDQLLEPDPSEVLLAIAYATMNQGDIARYNTGEYNG
jgi:hypothetical protein